MTPNQSNAKIKALTETMTDWIEMAMLDSGTRLNCCGKVDKPQLMDNIEDCIEDGLQTAMARVTLDAVVKTLLQQQIQTTLCAVAAAHLNKESFTLFELDDALTKIRRDISVQAVVQLKPYVALLGLCGFPERF